MIIAIGSIIAMIMLVFSIVILLIVKQMRKKETGFILEYLQNPSSVYTLLCSSEDEVILEEERSPVPALEGLEYLRTGLEFAKQAAENPSLKDEKVQLSLRNPSLPMQKWLASHDRSISLLEAAKGMMLFKAEELTELMKEKIKENNVRDLGGIKEILDIMKKIGRKSYPLEMQAVIEELLDYAGQDARKRYPAVQAGIFSSGGPGSLNFCGYASTAEGPQIEIVLEAQQLSPLEKMKLEDNLPAFFHSIAADFQIRDQLFSIFRKEKSKAG